MTGGRRPLRRLGLFDLTVAGTVFIAPAFSLAAIYYHIALQGGGYAVIGVILGALAALLVAISFAEMSKYYPRAGGAYSIVGGELTRVPGFIAGWGLAILYFLGPAIPLLLVVWSFAFLFPTLASVLVPLTVLVAASVFAINFLGLRPSIRVSFLFFLAEAAILVGIAALLFSKPAVAVPPTPGGAFGVLSAIGLSAIWTVFLFLGFDSVTTYSEEAKVPLKDVSRGTVYALAIAAVIYVVSALAYVRAIPAGSWAGAGGTLAPLAGNNYLGTWGGDILSIVILTSSLGALIAVENTCARLFFAMGRDGVLPPAVSRLMGTGNTPGIPLGLSAIATSGLVLTAVAAAPDSPFTANSLWLLLTILPGMLTLGALIAYFLVSVAGFRRLMLDGKRWKALIPLGGMGVTFALIIFFGFLPGSFSPPMLEGVLLWFVAGAAIWGIATLIRAPAGEENSPSTSQPLES